MAMQVYLNLSALLPPPSRVSILQNVYRLPCHLNMTDFFLQTVQMKKSVVLGT